MEICKEFNFEAAHKLMSSYSTKCQNIHGHSYKVKLTFAGGLNNDGMVTDFGHINNVVKPFLEQFDHALMVCMYDDLFNNIEGELRKARQKLVITSCNPTSENLACLLFEHISKLHDLKVKLVKVSINETCTSEAVVTYKDNIPSYTINFIKGL